MSDERQYCTFYLEDHFFGIEVKKVQEVIRYQDMTSVPMSADEIEGLINLRGQIVTAIDLRKRLGLPVRDESSQPMNIVINTDDGVVSLLVDKIGDVMELEQELFERPPENMDPATRELVEGVYKLSDNIMLVFNTDKAVVLDSSKVTA